jgi:hypothetical protein
MGHPVRDDARSLVRTARPDDARRIARSLAVFAATAPRGRRGAGPGGGGLGRSAWPVGHPLRSGAQRTERSGAQRTDAHTFYRALGYTVRKTQLSFGKRLVGPG